MLSAKPAEVIFSNYRGLVILLYTQLLDKKSSLSPSHKHTSSFFFFPKHSDHPCAIIDTQSLLLFPYPVCPFYTLFHSFFSINVRFLPRNWHCSSDLTWKQKLLQNSVFTYLLPPSQPPYILFVFVFFFFKHSTQVTLHYSMHCTWAGDKLCQKKLISHLFLQKEIIKHAPNLKCYKLQPPLMWFLIWTACSMSSIHSVPKWASASKSFRAQTCYSVIKHCISLLHFQAWMKLCCWKGYIALSSPKSTSCCYIKNPFLAAE